MNFNFLIQITINSFDVLIKTNLSVLEACKFLGYVIPRFCYHELLSIAGNCRMCLVEINNSPKPVASCALPVVNLMKVFLDTPLVLKARENVLEILLINHPLDCPICDQGGECDLQDQVKKFGVDSSRYYFLKRGVSDKNLNPLIRTIMTRCIHCTRCVRFSTEILGTEILGMLNRGDSSEIGNYTSRILLSELSGNLIDLCPVGALTSKNYSFKTRPWELRSIESIDLTDSLGSNIYINYKDLNIIRIIPKYNSNLNDNLISDTARYFFDSLSCQRLYKFYFCTNSNFFLNQKNLKNVILQQIFLKIKKNIQNKQNIFLVDEYLDLESLNILKFLTYKYSIKLRLFKQSIYNKNYYFSNFQNKANFLKNNIKNFFFIASNLKFESAILNGKIRSKFIKEDINVYNLLGSCKLNYNIQNINLNTFKFLQILEGKNLQFFKTINFFSNPFFIIGESLYNRGVNFLGLSALISKFLPSFKIINIRSTCNSEGRDFTNIRMLTKKDLIVSKNLIAINLKETLQIYKYCASFKKSIFWLNIHGNNYIYKIVTALIPILPIFYYNSIYINLEQRAQQFNKIFAENNKFELLKYNLNIKEEFKKLLFQNINFTYLNFYFALVLNPFLFNNIFKMTFLTKTIKNSKNFIVTYPIKFYIEDYYLNSKFTAFSDTLANSSYLLRKNTVNFLK